MNILLLATASVMVIEYPAKTLFSVQRHDEQVKFRNEKAGFDFCIGHASVSPPNSGGRQYLPHLDWSSPATFVHESRCA